MPIFHLTCCPTKCLFNDAPQKLTRALPIYVAFSHLTCRPNKYPKCFQMIRPRSDPKPHRCICPFLILRVVTQKTSSHSKWFALETIPNPTGLYGPFSIDVLSKTVPVCLKLIRPENVCVALSHLTRCPKRYILLQNYSP